METEKLVNLNPDDILVRDNVRYALKPYRVDSLADNILASGGVRTPITVEKLDEPIDGKEFALVVGAYRTASVSKLNREQKAGLTIPARVVPAMTDAERLLTQVSENTDRENMSPLDKAIAAQKMLSAGISKIDVRKAFAAPGGRKGIKVAPASNAHINMLLSFLEFPKDIQRKIHDGVIGMGAAYDLTKYPRDKWDGILERAENDRIKLIDRDEKDEEKFLETTKKLEETSQAHEKVSAELTAAQEASAKAAEVAKQKADEVGQALKDRITAKGDEKKKAIEHFKAVEAELKSAQDVADKTAKEAAKLAEKAQTTGEKAQAAKDRLEAARKAKLAKKSDHANKPEKVTGKDIKKAAKKEGATTKAVKLNATEMRDAIKTLTINGKQKTKLAGVLILDCFDGKTSDGQMMIGIARLLGEEPMPAAPVPETKKK